MFVRVLTLSALLSASVFAGQYATSVKPLFADSSSKKVIGKLLPTTEVEVLKKKEIECLFLFQVSKMAINLQFIL